jgi:hypothetical protein
LEFYPFPWWDLDGSADQEGDPRVDDELLIFGKKPRSAMDAFVDSMLSSSGWSSPVLGPILRATDGVYRYVWDLMEMKSRRRRKAVRELPFRDLLLADALLGESAKTAARHFEGAQEMAEEMAFLADRIASQPWPQSPGRATRLRVEARIYQGDARRLQRDFKGAERLFAAAFTELHELPDYEQSTFYRHLSKLREDQGRLDEAASLLLNAMQVHCRGFSSLTLPASGIAELAYLHLKRNDPGLAMSLLTHLVLVDSKEGEVVSCALQIDLGRAMCLAALGLSDLARELLEQSLPRRRDVYERGQQLPYEWLECRIAVHLGDLDPAIPRLEAILRWLTGSGDLTKICLCSIDLALAYTKGGQAAQRFPGLLKEIAQLEGVAEQPWALGALWWYREAVDRGWDPAQAAREAADIVYLRENSYPKLARRMRKPHRPARANSPRRNRMRSAIIESVPPEDDAASPPGEDER